VAVAAEVGRDATMSSVGASAAADSALHDGVRDQTPVQVEALSLGVRAQVHQQLTDGLERFLGPTTKRVLESHCLSVAANTSGVFTERNNLLVLGAVLQVVNSLVDLETFHRAGNFVGVFVVNTEVCDL